MDKSLIWLIIKKVRKNIEIKYGEKDGGGGGCSYDCGYGVRVVEWSFVEFRMKWYKLWLLF